MGLSLVKISSHNNTLGSKIGRVFAAFLGVPKKKKETSKNLFSKSRRYP